MRYFADIADEERTVDVEGSGNLLRATLGERSHEVRIEKDPNGRDLTVRIGHSTYVVAIQEWTGSRVEFLVDGRRRAVDVTCEVDRLLAGAKGEGEHSSTRVESVMPGIVTRILVKAGDDVTPGQPLLLLEAMKMENEVRAETAGRIASIEVQAGDTVDSGATLLTVGPASD